MEEVVGRDFLEWKKELESCWRAIPRTFQNDHTVRRTLQCHLYQYLRSLGYRAVADYLPPRIQDRASDLIALNDQQEIVYAICLETVVTLAAVKSLSSFAAANKVIFTTGLLEKKVQESRFFLKPDIVHLHLQPYGPK
ncbi:hypothetical protein [Desulfoferrobacter suflitae]|uniref:hypothetical protein n=1 Tax=Desulfoferrobacter suflitae TaxID=2865782 RepID=UPI0021642A18|nr:hypothetical protein [Desulfoferrobacter suflitae]MCK8600760.1 hypothetical protein [Desulfoferrobacter suflitae]